LSVSLHASPTEVLWAPLPCTPYDILE
jgi:hypothetical protein